MKFYYINNSLCEGCDGCSVACPSGAVYAAGGKRYIIHDKCTSCGACIRTCAHNAVSIESIDAMVERMENADLYLSRIRRLEQELSTVNNSLDDAEKNLVLILENSPSAMAICDGIGKIHLSNAHFKHIAGCAAGEKSGDYENLSGFVPAEICSILLGGYNGKEGVEFTAKLTGRNFSVQGIPLSDGTLLCVFDDLSDGHIASARISQALNKAVLRQMEMVRKIGTILGDETSSALNDINAALELIESTASDID